MTKTDTLVITIEISEYELDDPIILDIDGNTERKNNEWSDVEWFENEWEIVGEDLLWEEGDRPEPGTYKITGKLWGDTYQTLDETDYDAEFDVEKIERAEQ